MMLNNGIVEEMAILIGTANVSLEQSEEGTEYLYRTRSGYYLGFSDEERKPMRESAVHRFERSDIEQISETAAAAWCTHHRLSFWRLPPRRRAPF